MNDSEAMTVRLEIAAGDCSFNRSEGYSFTGSRLTRGRGLLSGAADGMTVAILPRSSLCSTMDLSGENVMIIDVSALQQLSSCRSRLPSYKSRT